MIDLKLLKPITVLMILLTINVQLIAGTKKFTRAALGEQQPEVSLPAIPENGQSAQSSSVSPFVPGDGIWVYTFPDTATFLNRPFPIDNNGMVEFPLIGKVKVTGMDEKQLADFLKNKFQGYLRFPNVRVKPVIRISVLGGVQRPGLYYVDYDNSLWEVMFWVGGTISEDGVKEMRLERDTDVVFDNLIPFYEKGISLRNMGVKSGDQIWVPSPDRPTLWNQIRQMMPVITFFTSLFFFYLSYQQQVKAAQTR